MEHFAPAIDGFKVFLKSAEQRFLDVVLKKNRRDVSEDVLQLNNSDQIEILKRLQREAFSDLMKLRDRQDSVERILSSSIHGKKGLFQENSTRVRGAVDVVGALFLAGSNVRRNLDDLNRSGVGTGIESNINFETALRQNDLLLAEFMSTNKISTTGDEQPHRTCQLSLAKVMCTASINHWVSAVVTPMGAQCKDFGVFSYKQGGISIRPSLPPVFSEYRGSGGGLKIKGDQISAALAGLVSEFDSAKSCLAGFGQLSCEPFEGRDTKVTLSGLWEIHPKPFQQMKIGMLAVPIFGGTIRNAARSHSSTRRPLETIPNGSVAVMLETELDKCTSLGGWVQMEKSYKKYPQWGVSMSDTPEDCLGWGLRMGGGFSSEQQVQLEGFLNLNIGDKFNLQPGFVMSTGCRNFKNHLGFMLHSFWSF